MKNGKYQTETEREALKQKTKFRAWIRNTKKKEITEADIYLEHRESSDFDNEEINIVIHDIPDYTNTDEQYHDVRIECSGEEDENEIRQYLTDYWEANLPFEFFYMPEVPRIIKLGEQEYLVYTMKTEQNLSYGEIAQVLEITESTARGQYRNAKAKIEEEMTKEELIEKLAERIDSLRDEALVDEDWERLRSDKDDEEEINQMFNNVNNLSFQKESELKYWSNVATDEEIKAAILKAKRICDQEEL